MAGARHPSTVKVVSISKSLLKQRKQLMEFAESLPNQDAYTYLYSVVSLSIHHIDECLNGLKPGLEMAQEELKKNPNQSANRGKKWKYHNDSHRKSRTSSSTTISVVP
jgi:hypothetical protein